MLFSICVTDTGNPVVNTFVLFPYLLFLRLISRGEFMKSYIMRLNKVHMLYGQIYLLFSERKRCCFSNVLFCLTGSIPGLGLRALG